MADITVKGTAFSSDAVTGDVYYRTDTDMNQWYTYDGARWLSEQVYECSIKTVDLTTDGSGAIGRIDDAFPIFIDGIDFTSRVQTTSDTDNFWIISVVSFGGAYTADSNTTVATVTTANNTAGNFKNNDVNVTLSQQIPDDYGVFQYSGAATGTPGNLTFFGNIRYRKIVT